MKREFIYRFTRRSDNLQTYSAYPPVAEYANSDLFIVERLEVLPLRAFVWAGQPSTYSIDPCECGNTKTQWSEYVEYLWCDVCKKDFRPRSWGVFDGPIPLGTAHLLGMSFDRVRISDGKVYKTGDLEYFKTRP